MKRTIIPLCLKLGDNFQYPIQGRQSVALVTPKQVIIKSDETYVAWKQ